MKLEKIAFAIILVLAVTRGRAEEAMTRTLKNTSLNRAADAVVSASSFRRSRLSEIKGGNFMLYAPQVWSWWIPAYAADKDAETFWACSKAPGEWIQLELGNRLMPAVPVKRVVINFGKDRPSRYALLGSLDGKDFQPLKSVFFEQSGPVVFSFDDPVKMRFLKIEFHAQGQGKGVSIRELQVFGPDEEKMPGPPMAVKAEAISSSEIKLSWKYPPGSGPAYLFKIFRGNTPDFPPDLSHLIEETDAWEFIDRGLKPGTTFYYKVVSEGFSGDRNLSAATVSAATPAGRSFSRFPMAGVVEGFYNQPFAHPERLRLIRFLAQNHLNYYIYAPKNDPYHRQLWRESYPEDAKRNFSELVQTAKALGVTFNYGISPGLNIDYNAPQEVSGLEAKLREMFELGFRAFTLCLDDIPRSNRADQKMALEQVRVVNQLNRFLKNLDPECTLFFVPTVYSFPYSHWLEKNRNFAAYLEALSGVDREVLIMWTGPSSVFSDTIDLASAAEYQKLWNRPLLIWDNYPVNDVGLQQFVFLGPYQGRDLKLGEAVAGIFANPMFLPNADRLALFTMGRYVSLPGYDPWQAYGEAMSVVGRGAETALRDLSDCLLNHPMFPSRGLSTLPASRAIEEFWRAYESGNYAKEAQELRNLFERYARNADELPGLENQRLWLELKPASEKLSLYAKACLKALDCLEARDRAEKRALAGEAGSLLKAAEKIRCNVADNRVNALYGLIGAKSGPRPLFKEFVKRALK